MKNLIKAVAMVLTLGTASFSFAGNNPAVTYPSAVMAASNTTGQVQEANPWNKGAVQHQTASFAGLGVWYTHCPVMTNLILNSKHEAEVTLSNGKQIVLSSANLKDVVEANLQKYEAYMYGGSAETNSDSRMAMASHIDNK
jgi:hypothetical protein